MEHADAVALIRNGVPNEAPSLWADLGCGAGTFTKALADLVAQESTIVAIDREHHNIVSPNPSVAIKFQRSDFTLHKSVPAELDGILIANALHYVSDQQNFLQNLISHLKPGARIIIVEYDTDRANQWVPYPIIFRKLSELLSGAGFRGIEKIGERNSVYRSDKIYAVVATV
ncbi:MAG: methyltransferase domain-containing protein [Cyclobacteriaceae bacterium]